MHDVDKVQTWEDFNLNDHKYWQDGNFSQTPPWTHSLKSMLLIYSFLSFSFACKCYVNAQILQREQSCGWQIVFSFSSF